MTIRQIAEASGSGINTVRRIGKMMFPEVKSKSHGVAIDYDENQSISIMDKLPKRNYVSDPTQMGTQMSNQQESSLTKKDLEMIGAIVANVMMSMESRVSNIENRIAEKTALLPPPVKDPRKALNQIVREYAQESLNNDYRKAWNNLYKDFYYRLDINIKIEADHWGCSPVEYLEKTDNIQTAISIVKELMGE